MSRLPVRAVRRKPCNARESLYRFPHSVDDVRLSPEGIGTDPEPAGMMVSELERPVRRAVP